LILTLEIVEVEMIACNRPAQQRHNCHGEVKHVLNILKVKFIH